VKGENSESKDQTARPASEQGTQGFLGRLAVRRPSALSLWPSIERDEGAAVRWITGFAAPAALRPAGTARTTPPPLMSRPWVWAKLVSVPAHSTRSSLGFGWYPLPVLAQGLPFTSTTSAVKSNLPWKSDEPTP
jgi:hypothetical protein